MPHFDNRKGCVWPVKMCETCEKTQHVSGTLIKSIPEARRPRARVIIGDEIGRITNPSVNTHALNLNQNDNLVSVQKESAS